MEGKTKVLLIDDSAVVRQTLSEVLTHDPYIDVIGTAPDPIIGEGKINKLDPDVIILDIEMPRMDGLTFLRKLMGENPKPVIICSSKTEKGSDNVLKAIEYGAVEIIQKPKLGTKQFIEESRIRITDAVKAASLTRPGKKTSVRPPRFQNVPKKLTADAVLSKGRFNSVIETTDKIIVAGASTGGTEALRIFLESMPIDAPGIVIVQHMPEHFTSAFARRLNTLCRITVKEAENNDSVLRGQALIAPGNKHALLKRSGARYYVEIREGPLVCRHRPSVDVLFRSAARYAGKNTIGVIMTGMGDDGARGLLELKESGAYTIAQDEETCVVFGMPKEAIKREAVHSVLPLHRIAEETVKRSV